MNIAQAIEIIREQRKSFRKLNGLRWVHGKYEYRLIYEGGFAEFFCIDRREIGRKNFRYFGGFGAWKMTDNTAVAEYINNLFGREVA